MIRIVGKGYKFILKQLDDFCGVVTEIIISLKSAEGRKKYEEVFERKIPEKVKSIKTRILSVFQTKLTDFSGKMIRNHKKMPRYYVWKYAHTVRGTRSNSKKETIEEPSDLNLPNKAY